MRAVPTGRATLAEAGRPLARAAVIAVAGAAVLVLVAGVLASTAGLLFVSGVMGAGIGLALSRAAAPSAADVDRPALPRGAVIRLAILLACLAVAAGAFGTWLLAIAQGGTLGPLDYLWTTFGPFVLAQLVVASIAAAWGAKAGPVSGR